MTHFEHYRSGLLYGIRYEFDRAGDGIPAHAHDALLAHNVVVLRGSVALVTDESTTRLEAGEVHDFDWSARHEIRALEDDSAVLHLFLNGMPPAYADLPAHELNGEFELTPQ